MPRIFLATARVSTGYAPPTGRRISPNLSRTPYRSGATGNLARNPPTMRRSEVIRLFDLEPVRSPYRFPHIFLQNPPKAVSTGFLRAMLRTLLCQGNGGSCVLSTGRTWAEAARSELPLPPRGTPILIASAKGTPTTLRSTSPRTAPPPTKLKGLL
jgi:hypothetical protein